MINGRPPPASPSQQAYAGRNPVLDVAQLEVLRTYGSEHDMAAGEVLFADGDLTYDLIVMVAGEARIIERRGQAGETVIATYGQGQFLGEIGLLTGQRAYLSAVASTAPRSFGSRTSSDNDWTPSADAAAWVCPKPSATD